jgi:hypothetical protein
MAVRSEGISPAQGDTCRCDVVRRGLNDPEALALANTIDNRSIVLLSRHRRRRNLAECLNALRVSSVA